MIGWAACRLVRSTNWLSFEVALCERHCMAQAYLKMRPEPTYWNKVQSFLIFVRFSSSVIFSFSNPLRAVVSTQLPPSARSSSLSGCFAMQVVTKGAIECVVRIKDCPWALALSSTMGLAGGETLKHTQAQEIWVRGQVFKVAQPLCSTLSYSA